VADYTANPERYEEASLPRLPFADNSFDLVLCSHFLFCYADRFELPFHLEALTELIRVSKSQVRIYPLADYLGNRPEWFADVLAWLTARGHRATVYPVDFRVMRNCTEMLLIEKHG
jgi:ubiquinone/menaquinone biosynthesis C-methylase UbiE